jgi:Ca2+-binding RTX toxin-like protein
VSHLIGGGGKVITGTDQDDNIFYTRKPVTVNAGDGNDFVVTGSGDDTLNGEGGDDELYSGGGNDTLNGGDGNDFLSGNTGNDILNGGADHDIASFTGEPPTATIGDANIGYVFQAGASAGEYTSHATPGGAVIDTMTGIEEIWGTNHNDTFIGGYWNEVFDARLGDDTLTGNDGADTFVFGHLDGLDEVTDFDPSEGDRIDLSVSVLDWEDLDTNENGVLDDGDDFVTVSGGTTAIDLGAAAGYAAGENVLTLTGASGLIEDDFIFV